MTKKSSTFGLIILGSVLGIALLYFPGSTFIVVLTLIIALAIWRFLPLEDRPFLFKFFAAGMLFRIMLYSILGFFSVLKGTAGWLIGDSWAVHNYAWVIAQLNKLQVREVVYWENINGQIVMEDALLFAYTSSSFGYHGYTKFLGFIYTLFGPMKFSARIFSCLMGVISGLFIYYIVKEIFGKRVAKLAAILIIFFPSLVLWSITFLKESPYIFFSCIVVWSFLKFMKTKRIFYLFIFILAILGQNTLREKFSAISIMLPLFLSYFIVSGISWKKKAVILICLLIVMVPLLYRINIINKVSDEMTKCLRYTRGVVYMGGSSYKIFDEKYYIGGSMSHSDHISFIDFTKGFFKGWFYLLFAPFPWKVYTGLLLASYPQVILWYMLIPFIFVGMITALRYKWKETFIILTYIIILGSVIAIGSGNIGTLFRHRDMVTPFFLIFGSLGLIKIFGQQEIFKNDKKNLIKS